MRQFSEKMPASGAGDGDDCMSMLKKLSRDEILEVLSGGFCGQCQSLLEKRINNLTTKKQVSGAPLLNKTTKLKESRSVDTSSLNSSETSSFETLFYSSETSSEDVSGSFKQQEKTPPHSTRVPVHYSPASVNRKEHAIFHSHSDIWMNDGLGKFSFRPSEEEEERTRFSQVGSEKNFVHIERINGRVTNVLQGLELHTRVFNAEEQNKIVECVYKLRHMGQKGQLRERTYSEPRKWMRGKGRVTIQFGCCYNYAVDRRGNPPGIIRGEEVDPLPPLFKQMIKRMVKWHILPTTCIPDSCIVNIYNEGDCIPPHIDHHDFVRPFCTVSFLTECSILFGSNLKILDAGEFSGPFSMRLPVGSVLVLKGNGADIAKHCVPAVSAKRISITFRKMDDSRLPYKYFPDPELLRIKPLIYSPSTESPIRQKQHHQMPYYNDKLSGRSSVTVMVEDQTRRKIEFSEKDDDFHRFGGQTSINRGQMSINKGRSKRLRSNN